MKKILVLILFIFLITLLTNNIFAQENRVELKNEYLASLLSFHIGGLGQFYAENPTKGTIFFLAETSFFMGTFFSLFDLEINLIADAGLQIKLTKEEDYKPVNITFAIIFGCLYIGTKIWDVADAYNTVLDYNKAILETEISFWDIEIDKEEDQNTSYSLVYGVKF